MLAGSLSAEFNIQCCDSHIPELWYRCFSPHHVNLIKRYLVTISQLSTAIGKLLPGTEFRKGWYEMQSEVDRVPSLTDVDGLLVGHCTLSERPSGCTVITAHKPFVAGVDVRGGAPGTREIELLKPGNSVDCVDAIFLSGGSAFGLETGAGVSRYLERAGRGFDAQITKVPIVCGAVLFDLALGDPRIRPDATAGFRAVDAAGNGPVAEGNVGAGAGATAGKMLGMEWAMKTGLGSWAVQHGDGLRVGALVAVNPVGDIVYEGKILAGARRPDGRGFAGVMEKLKSGYRPGTAFRSNTVLGVVATNAPLTKTQCTRVAIMAQDALARCIYPSHTSWDGDTVFAISTGAWTPENVPDVGLIGALAADVLASAIVRGVRKAESWGPFPSAKSWGFDGR
jgi:L-aminopeptidase/D-esterase-like protein